jgi:hypothetical protein
MTLLRSGCALILSLLSVAAFAQTAGRSFVSAGSGSDANACTRLAPCRSFGAAITTTIAGGEVIALDSGGYGPVSINKSISITSPAGVYAGITGSVALVPAVAVNAGASAVVILDGLTLNSTGSDDGIDVIAARTVVVKNVRITGFPDEGIFLTAPADVIVSDTAFRGNGDGIDAKCTTRATLSIEHSSFEDTDLTGILIDDNIDASIRNSVIHGTNGVGLKVAPTTSGATSQADVEACILTHNFSAIRSGGDAGTAAVRVSNSTITMNTFGLNTNIGSTLLSRSNNTLEANDSDGTFTGTFTAK